MKQMIAFVSICLFCSISLSSIDVGAQEKQTTPRTVLTHLDPGAIQFYSWFAETVMKLSERGDIDGAGRVARLMEMCWDRDSDKYDQDMWSRIDQASDDLVQPVEWGSSLNHLPTHATELSKVRAAYRRYIVVLKEESEASK